MLFMEVVVGEDVMEDFLETGDDNEEEKSALVLLLSYRLLFPA